MLYGTGTYTLTCDTGAYNILGSDALADFEITSEQGTYTITGQDASLLVGHKLTAEQGTYTITGQDAGGSIGGASRTMAADYGIYNLSGQDAALLKKYPLTAEQGFYAWLGQQATFSFGTIVTYSMPAEQGTYSLTGQDVTLTRSQKILACETGYYNITGYEVAEKSGLKPAGKSSRKRKKERYIARYKGQYYQFETVEDLEAFVAKTKEEQVSIPKKAKEPVKISISPDYSKELENVFKVPDRLQSMPQSAAMAFIRKMEAELKAKAKAEAKAEAELRAKIEAEYKAKLDEEENEALISWLL
jgi:hypothetical protein